MDKVLEIIEWLVIQIDLMLQVDEDDDRDDVSNLEDMNNQFKNLIIEDCKIKKVYDVLGYLQ